MSEELKPVRCGCGGEAKIETVTTRFEQVPRFRIRCEKCNISTIWDYFAEADAITAWNRAMSGNVQDCAKNARCNERKKGEWIEYPDCLRYEGAYADCQIVCSECHHVFSILDNCTEEFDFCPHCGADMRGVPLGNFEK